MGTRGLIVCIDTSGSMYASAATADGDGGGGDQITALQLCGHAVRTVIASLNAKLKNSPIAILTFSDDVITLQRPTLLNNNDIVRTLNDKIDLLNPGGCTNMWGVLSSAIDLAKSMLDQGLPVDVYLFTDGMPTESTSPMRGILHGLQEKIPKERPLFIHTFGFGPKIDSQLLFNIAIEGKGIFKYISDPGMVGTCLINSICKFISDHHQKPSAPTPLPVSVLEDLLNLFKTDAHALAKGREILANGLIAAGDHSITLDKEQLQIALSRQDFLDTWGLHYIRTLLSSHMNKHCGNFKDPGLQIYADAEFQQLQNEIETIFKKIAPPKGAAIKSMDVYVDPMGGCFSVNCKVTMADGSIKNAGDVRRGDKILTFVDQTNSTKATAVATVNWILRNNNCSFENLVDINGLIITKWHPIQYNHEWIFPCHHPQAKAVNNNNDSDNNNTAVVTFALDTVHSVIVEGIQCITLAHNIIDNPVLKHDFYGTEKVLRYIEHLHQSQQFSIGNNNGVVFDDVEYLRSIFNSTPVWCSSNELRNNVAVALSAC